MNKTSKDAIINESRTIHPRTLYPRGWIRKTIHPQTFYPRKRTIHPNMSLVEFYAHSATPLIHNNSKILLTQSHFFEAGQI